MHWFHLLCFWGIPSLYHRIFCWSGQHIVPYIWPKSWSFKVEIHVFIKKSQIFLQILTSFRLYSITPAIPPKIKLHPMKISPTNCCSDTPDLCNYTRSGNTAINKKYKKISGSCSDNYTKKSDVLRLQADLFTGVTMIVVFFIWKL